VPGGIIGITRRPTRREWRRAVLTFILGIAVVAAAILFIHPSQQLLPVGLAAPPITLRDSGGRPVTVVPSPQQGPVVIEFFDTVCVSCQREAATLCGIAAANPAATVVGVDAGSESAAAVAAYARRSSPCALPFLVDPNAKVSRSYAAAVVPTIYVVDRHGKIAYGGVGSSGIEAVSHNLQRLVDG